MKKRRGKQSKSEVKTPDSAPASKQEKAPSSGKEKTALSSNSRLRKDNLLVAVTFLAVAMTVNWKMITDGFLFGAYDIGWHMMWITEFTSQLSQGIAYPHWLDNANYGWGSATFVFYPPLTYYLAALLKSVLRLDAGDVVTVIFFLATLLAEISFYFFARQNHLNKIGATAGSVAYVLAPYFFFDIYFRAALAETLALAFIPLLFLCTDKAPHHVWWRIGLSFSFFLIALTHLPTLLIVSICWLPYALFRSSQDSKPQAKILIQLVAHAAVGIAMSGFYIVPAVMQQQYVNIDAVKNMAGGWKDHMLDGERVSKFVVLPDAILRTILASALLAVLAIAFQKGELPGKLNDKEALFWLILAGFVFFLMTSASSVVWQSIAVLQMLQFPWRFLSILSLAMAMLFALTVHRLVDAPPERPPVRILSSIAMVCILLTTFMFDQLMTKFRSGIRNVTPTMDDGTDYAVLTSRIQQLPKLLVQPGPYPDVEEYRPLVREGGPHAVPPPHFGNPQFLVMSAGAAKVEVTSWHPQERTLHVVSPYKTQLRVRTYWYPAWHAYLDGQPFHIDQSSEGAIEAMIPSGDHILQLRYETMPDQQAGWAVSAAALAVIGLLAGKNLMQRTQKE